MFDTQMIIAGKMVNGSRSCIGSIGQGGKMLTADWIVISRDNFWKDDQSTVHKWFG
jgi:hypothetical protein